MQTSTPLLALCRTAELVAPAPLFSGGAWDAWPGYVVDALSVYQTETKAIRLLWQVEGE